MSFPLTRLSSSTISAGVRDSEPRSISCLSYASGSRIAAAANFPTSSGSSNIRAVVGFGKSSRACSECRVKRRKCDLSKPACRQCIRAGSKCSGYRKDNALTFRDQTAAIIGKAQPLRYDHANSLLSRSPEHNVLAAEQPLERVNHDPYSGLVDSLEHQATHFFFHHYHLNGSGRSLGHPDCQAIISSRAAEPGYLASLVNAVGLVSLAYLRNAPSLMHAARRTYSWALRDIRTSLADPAEAASDQMLVAVMLLALYEVITCTSNDIMSSWSRHVDGALALLQLRGPGQLHNRLINCLQRRLRVPTILVFWTTRVRKFEPAQEAPASDLADIIVSACDVLASVKERTTDKESVPRYISNLLSNDQGLDTWAKKLPADYEIRTLTVSDDSEKTFLGRYHVYSDTAMVHTWNLQRCARIILCEALITTLSLHFNLLSSLPPPTFPLYEHLLDTSNTIIQDKSSDICLSVPYILHLRNKYGKSEDLRGACSLPLFWPLYIAGTAHAARLTLREWVVAQMKLIEQATGIQEAKYVASLIAPDMKSSTSIH
ncbi:hypothetical protein BJX70DRAFT_407613 [Aspergillus crustosus]